MDAAEHLPRLVDAMRPPGGDAVERRPAGAVDSGQPEDPDIIAQPLPAEIGRHPVRTPAAAHRRGLVHPRPAGIAIDPGRGKIAGPPRAGGGDRRAVAVQHRIAAGDRRNARQDMRRRCDGAAHGVRIVERDRVGCALAPGCGDMPAVGAQPIGQPPRGVTQAEYQHVAHDAYVSPGIVRQPCPA